MGQLNDVAMGVWKTKREAEAARRVDGIGYVVKLEDAEWKLSELKRRDELSHRDSVEPLATLAKGVAAAVNDQLGIFDLTRYTPGQTLDEAAARSLDTTLRGAASAAREQLEYLGQLVAAAKASSIHETLGFKSWTAYLADAIGGQLSLDVDTRRDVVALLDGEGMSQRAIAGAIGVSQKTVDRDLDELSHDDSVDDSDARRTGLDGKSRPAHPKRKPEPKREPLTAEQAAVIADFDHWQAGWRPGPDGSLTAPADMPKPEPEAGLSPEALAEFMAIDKRIDAADERIRQCRGQGRILPWSQRIPAVPSRTAATPDEVKVIAGALEKAARVIEELAAELRDWEES